ncbi:helix-turn-helix domain-containing protein [Bacillus sp. FJAT-26390]|uniref:helix-turn-helix domain-containing protein n=1 Tax=Bacillus sp. FJAT-26390 TaxID=1743142 RepID=UPI000807D6C5|nr:helix-turn-helix domain-containing protein [Bacillus sp. FJAT-26390]OBZ13603.1 AraC family transcriptional regulator [Bacillus sp. FJAT-26390]
MDQPRFPEPVLIYHVFVKDAAHFQKTEDTYDHWALFIVEEGSFEYRMGNAGSERAVKGEMVLCPPNLTFYRKTTGLSFHLIGFQWQDAVSVREGSDGAFPPVGKLIVLNNKRLNSTLSLFREARYVKDSLAQDYKNHLLKDLWYVYQIESFNRKINLLYSENPVLQRAVHRLQQQAEAGVSLKSVAIELGISQVQLTRLFKQEFQMTPSAYAANLRMDKVKLLLVNSSLTLAAIAEQCGFTDEHHLSKSFKQMFSINPSTYRKTYTV